MGAVVENYRTLQASAQPARCAAIVKADCYGLGAAEIAPALQRDGCRDFFVTTLAEARRLRALLGSAAAIYVLNGLPAGAEVSAAALGLIPVLNTLEQCRRWSRLGAAPAALQVDTGTSRLGLRLAEAEDLACDVRLRDRLDLVLVMSHLAHVDAAQPPTAAQLAAIARVRALFPGVPTSLANPAGGGPDAMLPGDMARPGAALYGLKTGPQVPLLCPVVSLKARILQLRTIAKGLGAGYGLNAPALEPMRVATLGVGYADGWRRSLAASGAAWLDGCRLPTVGPISMDSFMVDVTNVDSADIAPGDVVELIGDHQSVDDVARQAGTIGHEILTGLGARFGRFYL